MRQLLLALFTPRRKFVSRAYERKELRSVTKKSKLVSSILQFRVDISIESKSRERERIRKDVACGLSFSLHSAMEVGYFDVVDPLRRATLSNRFQNFFSSRASYVTFFCHGLVYIYNGEMKLRGGLCIFKTRNNSL